MSSPDEQWWILQAGEYVLGTLPATERATFEKLLKHDADALQYVTWWEERLAHLDATVEHAVPAPQVWQNISTTLQFDSSLESPRVTASGPETSPEESSAVKQIARLPLNQHSAMGRRVTFWRGIAGIATAASILLGFVLWQSRLDTATTGMQAPVTVISVVNGDTAAAFWVIDADPSSKQLRVTAVEPPVLESGKSFELWVVKDDDQGVSSMGLLPTKAGQSVLLSTPDLVSDGIGFAVSLEPEGGSPARAPTGPVLYQGGFQKVSESQAL